MTSFVMQYDIIYHFFPISSQYLMLWGGGGWGVAALKPNCPQ